MPRKRNHPLTQRYFLAQRNHSRDSIKKDLTIFSSNDKIRPILLGMKSLTYFRVYNRFGEMVFETSTINEGWNGIFKGKPQDTGTFVWMAQGVTFKGQLRTMKGFVVLIK